MIDIESDQTADEVADIITSSPQDYDEMDEEFSDEKHSQIERKKRVEEGQAPETHVEKLGQILLGLKTFYNVFRNLEAIPKERKNELLDTILDYHIQLNKDLIGYFHSLTDNSTYKKLFAYVVTMGGQDFLSSSISNSTLRLTIEGAITRTDNDFKKLLLIFLYSDLRLHGYEAMIAKFLSETKSPAAIEMIYYRVSNLMVEHDERQIPQTLKDLFRIAFRAKLKLSKGTVRNDEMMREFNAAIESTTAEHLQNWRARQ